MNESTKKVSNPLFSNAVTGGTFEDFSQNALLLPALKTAPVLQPPVQQLPPPATIEDQSVGADYFQPIPSAFENQIDAPSVQQNNIPIVPFSDLSAPPIQTDNFQSQPGSASNLSSVFSSFSNILKLSNNSALQQPIDDSVPPPAGLDALISQNPPFPPQPVPLFSPGDPPPVNSSGAAPPSTGPVNTFRRSGLKKRPVYAQVPGLSSAAPLPPAVPPISQPSSLPPISAPQTFANPPNFFTPTTTSNSLILTEFIPLPSSTSAESQDQYFKPISPQPTTSTILNPIPTQHLQSAGSGQQFFTPFAGASSTSANNSQSSVMSAMPTDEIMQAGNLNVEGSGAALVPNIAEPISPPLSSNQVYRPVYHHWFHKREIEGKILWTPFSMVDSLALDQAFTSNDIDPDKLVATDGGRYDVNILRRQRSPVYWKGTATEVRRCSWFHKGNSDGRFVPYDENIATQLEEEYKSAFESNQWHRKVELSNGETVEFHAPDVLVLFPPTQSPDAWGNTPNQHRPRIVKRGMDEFDIDEGEPAKVDHLLFIVHGIGSVCDLKFRTVEEVVEDFRSMSLQLIRSHYKSSCENGAVNRVEILPISWHAKLHSEDTGIDKKLKSITLESIPKLREFTNDTLLDILFYTSPIYCQTIISTVANELNRIYNLYKERNPDFNGGISLGGHSLGSVILFDLLCHQHSDTESKEEANEADADTVSALTKPPPVERKINRRISYMMSSAGTGQPQINYPHLLFQPKAFFALGSPIGMFITIRGLDTLGEKFALPTCSAFFNIFHPHDPVAYRVESLVNPDLAALKPVLIPHHKGRKRMHLELKETMARVGADLKQKVIDSMKSTWNSFYQLAIFHRPDQVMLEEEMDKALKEQMREREVETDEAEQPELTNLPLGLLNQNRRIDYVLQEAPFEVFTEYIFAISSHCCYWDSEDTLLLILKEIYSNLNVSTDDQIPQQTMTIERPPSSPKSVRSSSASFSNQMQENFIGMDPTIAPQAQTNLGPPPTAGFVRKT